MYKLSSVEALRTQILLDNALKKMAFLTSLEGLQTGGGGDELTQFMGAEISR